MLDNGTSLWVGDISPHMDAYFMQRAFMKAGHPCLSFKVIKDKQTQQCAGYGFANFPTLELAAKALSLLNGTLIPDSNPPTYFRLGWATHSQNSNPYSVPGYGEDFSVYVGDLSSDVTEVQLLDFFRKRYPNLRFARILYENGVSKGYGFLRYTFSVRL
jgi:RNA recognition motif-containing protein